ncbi:response regulator [Sphingomonas sp. RHCKR7]|uniref:response regulator transcription factor n=1 Tax=Sphingomonas folli TaxID=2862497 RepID=UPI001CA509D9|nr:response regulator [Sphingomonas folli]MBW6526475.1 response regulator [Sphingomonas folli]
MLQHIIHVLLVEDDPDISAIVTLALHMAPDFSVVAVPTGGDAINHLSVAPRPDIILIDNNLPDMDGVALASAIRAADPDMPPFAFLTASVRQADHDRFVASGALGVIAKPFDPISLATQVRALLRST